MHLLFFEKKKHSSRHQAAGKKLDFQSSSTFVVIRRHSSSFVVVIIINRHLSYKIIIGIINNPIMFRSTATHALQTTHRSQNNNNNTKKRTKKNKKEESIASAIVNSKRGFFRNNNDVNSVSTTSLNSSYADNFDDDAMEQREEVTTAQQQQTSWEIDDDDDDDFVPAGKAKKNKKKPQSTVNNNNNNNSTATPSTAAAAQVTKPNKAAAQQQQQQQQAVKFAWESEVAEFVPAGKLKKNKKKPSSASSSVVTTTYTATTTTTTPNIVQQSQPAVNDNNNNNNNTKRGAKEEKEEDEKVDNDEVNNNNNNIEEGREEEKEVEVVMKSKSEVLSEEDEFAKKKRLAQEKKQQILLEKKREYELAQQEAREMAIKAKADLLSSLEATTKQKEEEEEAAKAAAAAKNAAVVVVDEKEKKAALLVDNKTTNAAAAKVELEETKAKEENKEENIIPENLRDVFKKQEKRNQKRTSGSVTTGVRVEGLKKTFTNQQVLNDVTWDCKKGERVGLVGWNGAGKTTQLKIIMGEIEQDEGEVMLANQVKIGYLTQEFEVDEKNTVRQEFLASFGDESVVLKNLERVQKALENNPTPELMSLLVDKLNELQRQADRMDLFNMDRAIDKIMPELGFVPEDNDRVVSSFSGGWKMRITIGKILLQEPGLLLLDEPTNHIDLNTIQWLESYLKEVDVPLVVVSHDREFLDQICNKIVETERGTATTYKGNYSDYRREKETKATQLYVAWEKWQKEVTRQRELISRLAGGGQSGRATAAQKTLDKLLEESIAKPWEEKSRRFRFPDAPRSSQTVVQVRNLTHGYDEKTLFQNVSLQIDRSERVAMIGDNGCGKSTMMRLMQGTEEPNDGVATFGDRQLCKVNYFYQNQAEDLDAKLGVLETLVRAAPDENINQLKALLGRMAFNTSYHDRPVEYLSGGEKARLALAKFMVTPANVLLLDEPTNHLDIPSKQMLEEALQSFEGTVLAISHDRFFLRQIATRVLAFDEGKITDYEGDYAYYLEKNTTAGSRDKVLTQKKKEIEQTQIVAKSKMSKAEKTKLKKEKAKSFGSGDAAKKVNKNADRWS